MKCHSTEYLSQLRLCIVKFLIHQNENSFIIAGFALNSLISVTIHKPWKTVGEPELTFWLVVGPSY